MTPRPADFREPRHQQDHLTRHARSWHAEGEPDYHDGRSIDVHRRGGGAPLLLLLHGFPTSSFDWRGVFVQDRERAAVTFDYPGLGCSDSPADGDYSLTRLADLAGRLLEEHGQGRLVLIVAHDLGVSVAAELVARDIEGELGIDLAGAVLVNGTVVPGEPARAFGRNVLGTLGARFGGERRFRRQLRRVCSPDHPPSDEQVADEWSLLTHDDRAQIADRLLEYLDEGEAFGERWEAALHGWSKPVRLVWGMRDPIAGPAELERLRSLCPGAAVTELPDLGHFPHIEAPDRVYAAISEWVAENYSPRKRPDRADDDSPAATV